MRDEILLIFRDVSRLKPLKFRWIVRLITDASTPQFPWNLPSTEEWMKATIAHTSSLPTAVTGVALSTRRQKPYADSTKMDQHIALLIKVMRTTSTSKTRFSQPSMRPKPGLHVTPCLNHDMIG